MMGGVNVHTKELNMIAFCNQYKLKVLNKEPTCFENFNNPSCVELFFINSTKSFRNCSTLETGMPDFH